MRYSISYKISGDDFRKRREVELEAKPSNEQAQKLLGEWWHMAPEKFEILGITEASEERPTAKTIATN